MWETTRSHSDPSSSQSQLPPIMPEFQLHPVLRVIWMKCKSDHITAPIALRINTKRLTVGPSLSDLILDHSASSNVMATLALFWSFKHTLMPTTSGNCCMLCLECLSSKSTFTWLALCVTPVSAEMTFSSWRLSPDHPICTNHGRPASPIIPTAIPCFDFYHCLLSECTLLIYLISLAPLKCKLQGNNGIAFLLYTCVPII